MAEIFWCAGVGDDPLLESLNWVPIENGAYVETSSNQQRSAPRDVGLGVLVSGDYPMSDHQFKALWLPWWMARKRDGGCDNGATPFWMRDPIDRKPYLFRRQKDQAMQPVRDGVGWVIGLSLMRLPT